MSGTIILGVRAIEEELWDTRHTVEEVARELHKRTGAKVILEYGGEQHSVYGDGLDFNRVVDFYSEVRVALLDILDEFTSPTEVVWTDIAGVVNRAMFETEEDAVKFVDNLEPGSTNVMVAVG